MNGRAGFRTHAPPAFSIPVGRWLGHKSLQVHGALLARSLEARGYRLVGDWWDMGGMPPLHRDFVRGMDEAHVLYPSSAIKDLLGAIDRKRRFSVEFKRFGQNTFGFTINVE